MGKFRSKLKRHTKGKKWAHGHSSTTNPENKKHRLKAKSRFFQPNLSLAPPIEEKPNQLTLEAIIQHDAKLSFATANGSYEPTVNDIAQSLKCFNLEGEDDMSQSNGGTFKTFQTFASNYTSCTNASFSKLLNGFRNDSDQHKDMLAILAAVSEIINERGGTQTSTEYFLALMETLEASKEDKDILATISLLAMGIKTVPQAVLRKKFSDCAELLVNFINLYIDTENQNIIRSLIGCLSVLLRAQEYSIWTLSSTLTYFEIILAFTIHSKPKVRKAAHHAVISIMHGSCFMKQKSLTENTETETVTKEINRNKIENHPVADRVANFCMEQLKPDNIANKQTIILHTLALLRDVIYGLKNDSIKVICELLLSIMTTPNVLIRTNCFHALHSLFTEYRESFNKNFIAKLITALYDYRPDKSDTRQTNAWLVVLKQGHICLAKLEASLCFKLLPKFFELCVDDLWMSDRVEITNCSSNAIKDVLLDCVKPCCEDKKLATQHSAGIIKIINTISKALTIPFGHVAKNVLITFTYVFRCIGKHFADTLKYPISILAKRYDPTSEYRVPMENVIMSAITHAGAEVVISCIPICDNKNLPSVDNSWLLPLLRISIKNEKLEYFGKNICAVAENSYNQWIKYKAENNTMQSHIYELFYCQLWGLFPSFCRQPTDITYFPKLAKMLGSFLYERKDLRLPILDGLRELILNCEDAPKILGDYAKNYLPRLFNIYTTKPVGTYENDIRDKTLIVIEAYLKIAPEVILNELFNSAFDEYLKKKQINFSADGLLDIITLLSVYQSVDVLNTLLHKLIMPTLKQTIKKSAEDKNAIRMLRLKKKQKKIYLLLKNLLQSDRDNCIEFLSKNFISLEKFLINLQNDKLCDKTVQSRLMCLKILLEKQNDMLSTDNKLMIQCIPEAVLGYDETSKEQSSKFILKIIGNVFLKEKKLDQFVNILIAGFAGDTILIKNTIIALKTIILLFHNDLTINTLNFILEQVLVFLTGKQRNEVQVSLSFLMIFIKILPQPYVVNHLKTIVKSLSSMVHDTKRYCRLNIGYLLFKLCRRFTVDEVTKLIPSNDLMTLKRIKKIRKVLSKEKRSGNSGKIEKESDEEFCIDENDDMFGDDDDDEDYGGGGGDLNGNKSLKKKSLTIDDILSDNNDTDSDDSLLNNGKPNLKRKISGKNVEKTFIKETPDTIIDLVDINSYGKITTTRPEKMVQESDVGRKMKKDKNRGFKTAPDGRLIITDELKKNKNSNNNNEESSEDDDEEDVKDGKSGLFERKKRTIVDDDNENSDNEDIIHVKRKRRDADFNSMISGRTGKSSASKYTTGGKGIHRATSSNTTNKTYSVSGGTDKSNKKQQAGGDIKRKGQLEPYTYIALTRNKLNRRYKKGGTAAAKRKGATNEKNLKNIINSATKIAKRTKKSRIMKV